MQFGMLEDARLDKDRAFFGVEPHGQEIDQKVPDRLPDRFRVGIAARKGVPVGDKVVAFVFFLQPHPVLERAHKVSEVNPSAGLHSA
jgi:hypothetical protein